VKDPKSRKASAVGSTSYCLTSRTGKPGLHDQDQSYHCWAEFYAGGIGWIHHDVAVADLYHGDFTVDADNDRLVRLTTADGTFGHDPARVDYYFGNLDERRVVWSRNRDLTMNPKQDGPPVNALPKAYIEIDGTVHPEGTGWMRTLTYRDL
jgi:hypothetical protein